MNYKLLSLFLLITITSCQTDIFDDTNIKIVNKAISIKGRLPLIAHRGCWLGTEMPPNSLAAFINSLGKNIYGTEFAHSWALSKCADVQRTVVTVQGAMTVLKKHVYAGLPEKQCRDSLLHKLLRIETIVEPLRIILFDMYESRRMTGQLK